MATDIAGAATVLGDYVSADIVLPARHSFLPPDDMARNVLAEMGEAVNEKIRSHPILVVGTAFGYGTGRESPARALRSAGVRAIVGGPFARMFFRNCLNNGILTIECPALARKGVEDGDTVEISIDKSTIKHGADTYAFEKVAPSVLAIVESGGLVPYGKKLLEESR